MAARTALICAVQTPFVVVVLVWLAMLFLGIGLFSRANATTVSALITGALAVSGAMFLILELERTNDGMLRISDAPVRAALHQIRR